MKRTITRTKLTRTTPIAPRANVKRMSWTHKTDRDAIFQFRVILLNRTLILLSCKSITQYKTPTFPTFPQTLLQRAYSSILPQTSSRLKAKIQRHSNKKGLTRADSSSHQYSWGNLDINLLDSTHSSTSEERNFQGFSNFDLFPSTDSFDPSQIDFRILILLEQSHHNPFPPYLHSNRHSKASLERITNASKKED